MNIIWLCSWYPNSEDYFTGDFIQRQAVAVSQFANIEVVHVVFCDKTDRSIRQVNPHLTENIFYQKRGNALRNLWNYYLIHKNFLEQYQKVNGKVDAVHVQIPIKAGVVAIWFKYIYKIPYLVTEHYGIYNLFLDDHYQSRNILFRYFTKWIVRNANLLTTVSNSLGNDMNELVTKKEFAVVSNVVDTSLFTYCKPKQTGIFRFIHISNMIPLKNIRGIIEAADVLWQIRQDFMVVIVGSIVEEYVTFAQERKMLGTAIFFKGEVPYSQIAAELKESQSLIIFSDTESQSCVVLESLCSGRPAIVTDVGGVTELIDNSNGYKVNVKDNADLVKKMNLMIDNYGSFDTENISKKAVEKYSYDAVGRQFCELYKSLSI